MSSEPALQMDDQEIGRKYTPDTDLNENGIPDAEERDFSLLYDERIHPNGPTSREDRHNQDLFTGTYDFDAAKGGKKGVMDANAEIARIQDENDRLPHKEGYSSGDLQDRIDKIRKKRVPKSSYVKELSKMPANKSDAENGMEIGKHAFKGLTHGLMSSHKDAENARDARLAAELEEHREAQKALDRAEAERVKSEKEAREIGDDKTKVADQGQGPDSGSAPATPTSEHGPNGPTGSDGGGSTATSESAKPANDIGMTVPSVDGIKATGEASMGLAVSAINPAAGVALGAVQANETQKQAGTAHHTPGAKKVENKLDQSVEAVVAGMEHRRATLGIPVGKPVAANANCLSEPARGPSIDRPKTGLFAQASKLAKPAAPTLSQGPKAPAPRVRAQGLGTGIGGFMRAVRALAPSTPEISAAAWQQKSRDSGGLSR